MNQLEPAPGTGADDQLRQKVRSMRWYHTIPLTPEIVTPGVQDSPRIVDRLHLPTSLASKSVLDIGAFNGFFSFHCAGLGADRVLATDCFAWRDDEWGIEPFNLAREVLGLADRVEDQHLDVMDLSPEQVGGTFDVVLFLGVLYHLRDPITALERAASVCDDLLVLETETALNALPTPAGRIYVDSDLNADPTNWYAFNVRALERLLRRFGFGDVSVVYRTPFIRRVGRAARDIARRRDPRAITAIRSQRAVLHARR